MEMIQQTQVCLTRKEIWVIKNLFNCTTLLVGDIAEVFNIHRSVVEQALYVDTENMTYHSMEFLVRKPLEAYSDTE